jgi:hypothetical protein
MWTLAVFISYLSGIRFNPDLRAKYSDL